MAIKRAELEERVLGALKNKLMHPALFSEFCDEFTREMNRLRIESRASSSGSDRTVAKGWREAVARAGSRAGRHSNKAPEPLIQPQ
jgi:hypothetical protein